MPARSPSERLRLSNAAFVVTFGLLLLLAGWWTVLISRLVNENYALQVEVHGESPEAIAQHDRRRFMMLGETGMLSILALSLVALAYRYAEAERRQIRRLEGLLAASTHELKTPVAGVRALLESLQSGVLPPDKMAPHLTRGLGSVSRLEHLIEGILAHQALVARPSGDAEPIGLRALVDEVVQHRSEELPGEVVVVEGDAPPARGRADAVRVVLENLLDNARKYGGDKPVRVRIEGVGSVVRLAVIDEGAGFSPGDAELMFEPYERGTAGQRRHGTGLGLYIARTLARGMGGGLEARSAGPGSGATFTLTLRRASDG